MMRIVRSVCSAAALASVAFACASAYAGVTVTPPGPTGKPIPFTASGPTTLSKSGHSIGCNAVLTGQITGTGEVKITGASFTGAAFCSAIVPTFDGQSGHWQGNVESKSSLALDNVAIDVKLPVFGGKCGPTNIKAAITQDAAKKETVISFSHQQLSGGCEISGSTTTTPYMVITD